MKKLYYSLVVIMLAMLSSCASKMGELSPEYFTVTPQVLEAVGGKVPATINGRFPEKYFNKKAIVEVTPVLARRRGQGTTCHLPGREGRSQLPNHPLPNGWQLHPAHLVRLSS